MKILKLSTYYEPEIISSSHLNQETENALIAAGNEITILAPTPTRGVSAGIRKAYSRKPIEEQAKGKRIIKRFKMFKEVSFYPLKALRYVLISIIEYYKGLSHTDVDVIVCGSTAPTQVFACVRLAKKLKVPVIYKIGDMFPESLLMTQLMSRKNWLYRFLDAKQLEVYSSVDQIIVVSEMMQQRLLNKGVRADKINIVYDWVNTESLCICESRNANPYYEEIGIDRDQRVVMYAGNLGKAQNCKIIIDAAEHFRNRKEVIFLIVGGGNELSTVKSIVKEKALQNVTFYHPQPYEKILMLLQIADVALVTCLPGAGGISMPSKAFTSMYAGVPIAASYDLESELASVIKKTNCGLITDAGDLNGFIDSITELLFGNFMVDIFDSAAGKRFVTQRASKKVCLQTIEQIYDKAYVHGKK